MAWGDFDNDGYLDLAVTGDTGTGYVSRIYRNIGTGTFTNLNVSLPGRAYSTVAWGD